MACLLAAAIHDHGHQGLSNNFLVKSSDELALRYNDQHVNEHHHISSAFVVLRRPDCNFLVGLTSAEHGLLRSLIINLVLGTDMADDKKVVMSLNKLLEDTTESSKQVNDKKLHELKTFTPASEQEVLLALQVSLKCADV